MFFYPQFLQPFWRQRQFGGVGFAGQANRRKHLAAFGFDRALQVGQRATHAHEIIDQHVFATGLNRTGKFGLPRQARKPVIDFLPGLSGGPSPGCHRATQAAICARSTNPATSLNLS